MRILTQNLNQFTQALLVMLVTNIKSANGPVVQWTNGPMDHWLIGPMDQWTHGPMDQWTN